MRKHPSSMMAVLAILMLILAACSNDTGESASEAPESQPATTRGRGAKRERGADRPGGMWGAR